MIYTLISLNGLNEIEVVLVEQSTLDTSIAIAIPTGVSHSYVTLMSHMKKIAVIDKHVKTIV